MSYVHKTYNAIHKDIYEFHFYTSVYILGYMCIKKNIESYDNEWDNMWSSWPEIHKYNITTNQWYIQIMGLL